MFRQLADYFWFRLLASAVIAGVIVITFVGGMIHYYKSPDDDTSMPTLHDVRIISLADNPALADAIRKERERTGSAQAERQPPPPPIMAEREVAGFVQVEYTINADGSVSDARVLSAAPSGVYEQRALAEISRGMHTPAYNDDGEPVARRATDVVEFSVPASELLKSR